MEKLKHKILYKYRDIILYINILRYKLYYKKICRRIKSKDKVNIVFFAINVGMWKNDNFVKLLMKELHYNPIVVSYLYPHDTEEYKKQQQEELSAYFASHNIPYIDSYNFETRELLDINSLNPDIIFYAQPYDAGYSEYKIKNFWKKCLFAYTPYCFLMETEKRFYNTLLLNIACIVYTPTKYHLEDEKKYKYNRGANNIVVGHPLSQQLISNTSDSPIWKIRDRRYKRIIWAPHHSILAEDALSYSTFLEIYEFMLEMAHKYSEDIQIVFKPHPILKSKLYSLPSWGKKATDEYYNKWESFENTNYTNGSYIDLFCSSDAMIHDCSSFIGEYLHVNKPVLFVAKEGYESGLNTFAKECMKFHYKACTKDEIEDFIIDIIRSKDPMYCERSKFIHDVLISPNNEPVEKKMLNELNKIFEI